MKANKILSKKTLYEIKMTSNLLFLRNISILAVFSFTELVPYLFSQPGVKCFMSERLNQDPLEKFFGKQQQRGRVKENPTVNQALKNNQALRVISSINLDVVLGNTRGTRSTSVMLLDKENQECLPKRRRLQAKTS
jgi:hypothetical protein